MNNIHKTKNTIYLQLLEMVDEKIEEAKIIIKSAKESRDQETKSSAGDKYEAGRAMVQMEIDKGEIQLNKAQTQKTQLLNIDIDQKHQRVAFGSMVVTNHGTYFMSIGIGRIIINDEEYYCLSLVSPIGKFLNEKSVGDKFKFQEKEFVIKDID